MIEKLEEEIEVILREIKHNTIFSLEELRICQDNLKELFEEYYKLTGRYYNVEK